MEKAKKTKWDLDDAISKGKASVSLLNTHKTELTPRLRTNEFEQHSANVTELELSKAGQKQTLTSQKSQTQGQDTEVAQLGAAISSIRNMVSSNNPTAQITVAYGIGTPVPNTVPGVLAGAKVLQDAYKANTAWSNDAGIIEADMTTIENLIKAVLAAEKGQDDSVFVRTAKTTDKNTLQRNVENETTRISAMGMHHFSASPEIAAKYAALIPSTVPPKPAATKTDTTK